MYERAGWGWLAWTVPSDGTLPERPKQIGVLTPGATRRQRLAVHWLTRRPATRIALNRTSPVSLRLSTAAVGVISLCTALFALHRGVPADTVLPAMLLAPLLTEHLPDRIDERAGEHVRMVKDAAACQYLQRLAAMLTSLAQAAAGSNRYELRRSAEIGHNMLWGAADLLQDQDTRAASAQLIDRERLMVQLVDQVTQTLEHIRTKDRSGETNQPGRREGPSGPYPPGSQPTTPRPTPGASLLKGTVFMPQPESSPAARTPDVYLLFAHEPYYPGPDAQEINTTVVAAGSLLHPQVCQPDGVRIHDLLTRGRRPGEIIPLATLTQELGGGANWPKVSDWERVTAGLLHLVRSGDCDALSLGLPEIARALVCIGPDSQVRAFDAAADEFIVYGAAERAAVLAEVDVFLAGLVAEQDLWPGDGLLAPLARRV
ncbi:hypothetical protein A6P39_041965 (plasmid) [Streptomyces sp. FXJ1.172]|uniref:hypothetical protein n=1 Tax=Streptomyces sp. FXJ1.172 TaxID=710705 RepID=UPI0023DD2ECD|nr:hypothetical protein [Streptomyces sp. FXJ1.172]WEP00745.1 hypothetical protein A6P39_041965 [Streptomyces sp. FXJ1.172]